jgi:hypothetical protein
VDDHWLEWHRAYDDPAARLSRRRAVVVRAIRSFLDGAPGGPIRLLSLCAGDATDISLAVGGHHRRDDITGAAVELHPALARRARENLERVGARVEVLIGDAGRPTTFADVVPVDLMLLIGVFGNVTDGAMERTVRAVPSFCRPGATVIWSRHRRPPDMTSEIRRWFDELGATPTAFVSEGTGGFAVGTHRVDHVAPEADMPEHLFEFTSGR